MPTHSRLAVLALFLVGLTLAESKCAMKNSILPAKRDPYLCTNQFLENGPILSDPENCQCYFHCTYQQEPCYMCCADGQVFNPDQKRCLPGDSYRCVDQPARFKCPGHGYYPNPKHCRKYWNCTDRDLLPVEQACPEKSHWNNESKLCRSDTEVPTFEFDVEPYCVKD